MSDLLFSMQTLPEFSKIKINNIEQAISEIITENTKTIDALLNKNNENKEYTWDNFIIILEELSIKLANAWSPVSHLNSVASNEDLRKVYENVLNVIIKYSLELEQNPIISEIYNNIFNNQASTLDQQQKKLLEYKILDFTLAGVNLPNDAKNQYKSLSEEISNLSTKFNNNIMDCTDAWSYHVTDINLLKGISENIINLAKQNAEQYNQQGYLLGLDAPTYLAVLKNCHNRDIRKAFHFAYATRAAKSGPHDEQYDNEQIIFDILTRKYQKAKLLGYNNYAEFSLATKMIKKPEEVVGFLRKILENAKVAAKKEWEELKLFAKSRKDELDKLQPWDIAYYSELQKNKLFDLSDDELSKYFPLDKVLSGFFQIINKLYKINFRLNKNADTWHEDVLCYELSRADDDQKIIGYVYLDLFARPKKRNGAWMDECRVKCQTNNIKQLPVAYLTCNFTASIKDQSSQPSLLTHNDVLTLFHEFGHCLQHLLTQIGYPTISGINGVPWDAVELASQFHENWCWRAEGLELISGHYKTGEVLPNKILKQLVKQKNYQAGMFVIRQLIFGLFDMKLHMEFHPDKGVSQVKNLLKEVRDEIAILPYAEYDQFQNSFSHIFAGGYAAGYYSYLWAEVLAANCFSKFDHADKILCSELGQQFKNNFLEQGGSIDYKQAVEDFCDHELNADILLKYYGLIK